MKFFKYIFFLLILVISLLAIRMDRNAADFPISEDGFFAMTVSYNFIHGDGITVDKENPTNGFQPLFTFLSSPLFIDNDKLFSVRLLIVLQLIVLGLSAYLIGKIAWDIIQIHYPNIDSNFNWLLAVVFLSAQTNVINFINGLETGFYLLMILICWRYYARIYRETLNHRIVFGILLGLTVLTRIDFAFFVAIFFIHVIFLERDLSISNRFNKSLLIGGTALIISSPWWIYNLTVFGSLMPISGKAQQMFDLDTYRLYWSAFAITGNVEIMTGKLSSIIDENVVLIFRTFITLLVIVFAVPIFRKIKSRIYSQKNQRLTSFYLILLIFSVMLIIWYTISNWAVYFYPRYFMPFVLITFPLAALLIHKIYVFSKRLSITFAFVSAIVMLFFISTILFKIELAGSGFLNEQLPLIEQNVPPTELVASGQTGTIGYFLNNVVNLDGKVNYKALEFREHMWDYLDQEKIPWFCDWKLGVDRFLGTMPENNGWILVDSKGQFLLYHKKH